MEILIVFVIMMIISSLLRSFRNAERTSPPPFGRPQLPLPPEIPNIPEGKEEEPSLPRRPGYAPFSRAREKDELLEVQISPLRLAPLPLSSPRESLSKVPEVNAYSRREAKDETRMKRHLEELLSGEGLPYAIVALEIFSEPRAKRPFKARCAFLKR